MSLTPKDLAFVCCFRNCIVAIDAEKFYPNEQENQYKEGKMKRELLKSYTGFSVGVQDTNLEESKENDGKLWIATGNWGCGVFGGDIELKCIIQWIAASLAGRKIKYFGFGDKGCLNIESFVEIMRRNKVTVGMLWKCLCQYSEYRQKSGGNKSNNVDSVMNFVVRQIGNGDKLKANMALEKKKFNDVDPSGKVHVEHEDNDGDIDMK